MAIYTILPAHADGYDDLAADSPEAALKLWGDQRRRNTGAVACYTDGQENYGPNFWVYSDSAFGTIVEPCTSGPGDLDYRGFVCVGAGWARRYESAHCSIWLGGSGKWHWLAYDDKLMQRKGVLSSGGHGFLSSGEAYEAMILAIAGPNRPLYINLTRASACLHSIEGVWRWDSGRNAWVHPTNTGLAVRKVSTYWHWVYTADIGTEYEETFCGEMKSDPITAKEDHAAWIVRQLREARQRAEQGA